MDSSKLSLKGKVAIVTGGSEGIGRAISLGLAEAGASVAIVCRRATVGEEVAAQVRALGSKALVIPADVTIKDKVVEMVNKTIETFGTVDILVNNVGGARGDNFSRGPILSTSETDWDRTFAVNMKSVFLCSQAVAGIMLKNKKGVIINMASIFGEVPFLNRSVYSTAKAGVMVFTKHAAMEWGPYIRVNAISPGLIGTEKVLKDYTPERIAERNKGIPLGRIGQPEDIASMAVFLASDAASWITGATMDVNGGER